MPALLATGGRVLTPASRDATAMAYENGLLTWAGADAPGPALFPEADRIDLGGDWVAPAFVDCVVDGSDTRVGSGTRDGSDIQVGTDPAAAAAGVVLAALPAAHGLDAVDDRVRAAERVILGPGVDPATVAAELTRLAGELGGPAVARTTPVLIGAAEISDDDLSALASVGAVLLIRPLIDDLTGLDLVRIAASGVALAATVSTADSVRTAATVGTVGTDHVYRPWDALRALTSIDGGRGLSPRAAFTATTRGARRAAGARDGLSGTLAPGAPATYARWETGELAVVAADDAVQRWSTDPRSGVPPLPDLTGPDPVLRSLVVDGTPADTAE
ncbi:MAG: amidohydrolase [Actinomycetales bacterium]|nr:amidohydrolase [Actinomycetales bacterium]